MEVIVVRSAHCHLNALRAPRESSVTPSVSSRSPRHIWTTRFTGRRKKAPQSQEKSSRVPHPSAEEEEYTIQVPLLLSFCCTAQACSRMIKEEGSGVVITHSRPRPLSTGLLRHDHELPWLSRFYHPGVESGETVSFPSHEASQQTFVLSVLQHNAWMGVLAAVSAQTHVLVMLTRVRSCWVLIFSHKDLKITPFILMTHVFCCFGSLLPVLFNCHSFS